MTARTRPPFRADQVGSLIRPQSLIDAIIGARAGQIAESELRAIRQAAIREVVRQQEDIGFKAVTDGEFNRSSWHKDFLLKIENVSLTLAKFSTQFRSGDSQSDHAPHTFRATGVVRRARPIFVEDLAFLRSITRAEPKVTLPSPSVMHFRGGRDAIDATAYPDLDGFYADLARVYQEEITDLAAAGCRYVQLDEVNFAYLCDPKLREEVRANIGEDPETLPKTYAKLINAAIATRPKDMVAAMHLCRGNFAGRWMAEGGYDPVAEVLFNEINVDGYFLEYDTPRAGSFEPLRFVPKGKMVVLGLITTKTPVLESKDDLKRRIDEAARHVPFEQLALSPQCGFSSGLHGNTMNIEQELAKLRLVVEVAEEVWGSA
jgi:5-methyltetrahydropteroyltriglutamate--homocysteine methyltransferase